jgi:hypothetical protein
MRRYLPFLLGLALASASHAQMYKCVGSDGRVSYGDRPCPAQSRAQALKSAPASTAAPAAQAGTPAATPAEAKPGGDAKRSERIHTLDRAIADQEALRDDLYRRLRQERALLSRSDAYPGGVPTGPFGDEHTALNQGYHAEINMIDANLRTLRQERQQLLRQP